MSFRAYTQRQAIALGLSGWVRNLEDGRVEAVFEGERVSVDEMLVWCKLGSPGASVAAVEALWEEIAGEKGFVVRR